MRYERIKNTKKNIIFASVFKFVATISPVVIRSIIIRSLGEEYAGLSTLFSSILTVLSVSELGFGSAVIYAMYDPIARDDYGRVGALLTFYKHIYRLVSSFILFGGLCIIFFLKRLIGGDYPQEINIYFLYIIYLLNTITSYMFGSYKRSVLIAHQQDYVINKISTAITLPTYFFEIIVLIFFKNYYFYVICILLSGIIINVLISCYVDRNFKEITGSTEKIKKDEKIQIISKVRGLLVNRVLSVSRTSSDTIFITYFCGLVINTYYSNYLMVVMTINGFLLVLINSMTGGIGNGIVINNKEKNYKDFLRINCIYMFMCSLCIIGMVNYYDLFISICFGERFILSDIEKWLFCTYFFVISAGNVKNIFINAAGLWDRIKGYLFLDATFNCLLNLIGVNIWGIAGVVMATIISMTVFDLCFVTKTVFSEVFDKCTIIPFIKFNLFWFATTILILQIGRLPLSFSDNLFFSSSLYFCIEVIILSCFVWILSRYVSIFHEAKQLMIALVKMRI